MKTRKMSRKNKRKLTFAIICISITLLSILVAKANEPKVVGYTYTSGSTVWDMAREYCPSEMDVRDFAYEIERINGIKNSVVSAREMYKIPIYEK